MINVSDLKPGVTFQMDGNLFVVLDYSHNKTARAAANIKVKMKNLRTGSTTEMTFGGNDKVKRAQIDKKEMQYLYNTGDAFVFMDGETYEQIEIPAENLEWEKNFMGCRRRSCLGSLGKNFRGFRRMWGSPLEMARAIIMM